MIIHQFHIYFKLLWRSFGLPIFDKIGSGLSALLFHACSDFIIYWLHKIFLNHFWQIRKLITKLCKKKNLPFSLKTLVISFHCPTLLLFKAGFIKSGKQLSKSKCVQTLLSECYHWNLSYVTHKKLYNLSEFQFSYLWNDNHTTCSEKPACAKTLWKYKALYWSQLLLFLVCLLMLFFFI